MLRERVRRVVVAMKKLYDGEGTETYLFRSYDHQRRYRQRNTEPALMELNPGDANEVRIWEAGLATASAPLYFRQAKIAGIKYMDGAVGANNPSMYAYGEVKQMLQTQRDADGNPLPINPPIGFILSVGTGKSKQRSRFGAGLSEVLKLMVYMRKAITDPLPAHINMMNLTDNGRALPYVRLDVAPGMDGIKLDQWKQGRNGTNKTRDHMESVTRTYLARNAEDDYGANIQRYVRESAQRLVDSYRRRHLDPGHDQNRSNAFFGPQRALPVAPPAPPPVALQR
jgi:hypothetical protein